MLLPVFDNHPDQRVREIERKKKCWLYGKSLLGNTPHYLEGELGNAVSLEHQQRWYAEAQELKSAVYGEAGTAYMAIAQFGGIQQLSDYYKLYDNQWLTSAPDGVSSGYLANFTSDLLFAMERLSANPYSIHRLHPTASSLPFLVDDDIATNLTGWGLDMLHKNGRLFFVDHSYQSMYPTAEGNFCLLPSRPTLASILHASIRDFMTAFVSAYYTSSRLLALDNELQSFIAECTLHADVIDFPSAPLTSRTTLIDILTHLAFLNSVSHNTLNGAELFQVSGTLPLHPAALYSPPPTAKGPEDIDIMSYLPPLKKSIEHVSLVAFFGPTFSDPERTMAKMFEGEEHFNKGFESVSVAAKTFKREMEEFSEMVNARGFDGEGLCMGMPFVWRALDPVKIPCFLNV
ncbi:lipoxygenase [Cercophora newfieldiana]|uniref:Manganese lipoxygenase n=1 Tax=Cercophora newfieldiana TaxID=92897 RepID=A0AA39Y8T5_9PEZI|nr:lipoxygenase [Cercophora newfieldiana]